MKNFNYNKANQSILNGYRLIALKNIDLEKLANANNMKEPDISVGPEAIVEPQEQAQETSMQSISDTQNVSSETLDKNIAPNIPVDNYRESTDNTISQENFSVNPQNINIPEPVVTPQPTVSQSYDVPQHEPVINDGNIFDAPVVRESVEPNPVAQQEMVQSSVETGTIDLDEFIIKSQEIYDKAKVAIEDVLVKSQREQMNLAMQMMKNLQQLKADNVAYSNAIDQVVNDESFKKVA